MASLCLSVMCPKHRQFLAFQQSSGELASCMQATGRERNEGQRWAVLAELPTIGEAKQRWKMHTGEQGGVRGRNEGEKRMFALPNGLVCLSGRSPASLHFGICFFHNVTGAHFPGDWLHWKNYRVLVYEKEVIIYYRPFAGYYLMSHYPYQESSRLSLTWKASGW